ncbi:Uncharacterized protein FWK35_00014447, partial [Aphis craccivora]
MYEELSQLVCIIAGYVYKENVISEWLKNNTFDLFCEVNLRDITDLNVHLPNELNIHLNNLFELDKQIFLRNVRKHLDSAGNHILNNSSIKDSSKLKYFRCLKSDEIKKSRSSIEINKIASIMPFKVDCNKLVDEWKLLRFESLSNIMTRTWRRLIVNRPRRAEVSNVVWLSAIVLKTRAIITPCCRVDAACRRAAIAGGWYSSGATCLPVPPRLWGVGGRAVVAVDKVPTGTLYWRPLRTVSTKTRIEHFWNNIFDLKSGLGEIKYSTVTKVVRACLTLSHGSAEVERGFSRSGNILTDDKSAMSCRMSNGRLNIQDGLRIKKKKKRKQKKKINKNLEEEQQLRREEEKQLIDTKENIVDLEKQYLSAKKVEAKQKKAADTFLEEATERRQKAINSNDLVNAQVAVGMIDAAKKLRDNEQKRSIKTESLQTKIEKKKI